MEIDDEDVVVHGTDLEKYLNAVGYSEFEVSNPQIVREIYPPKSYTNEQKYSKKVNKPTQNRMRDFELCLRLINLIMECQLMFKEDILFIKKFVPSEHNQYPLVFTKQNSVILLVGCIIYGVLRIFCSRYLDERTAVGMLILWFGYLVMDILYKLKQNRTVKKTVLKTLKSMENISLLIQKTCRFLHECDNLQKTYSFKADSLGSKNANALVYLLMPELKTVLLTVIQDLINCLQFNISDVHTFFPLKHSVSNVVYLYLTDCKIDLQNISLENINKAKYTYFLLQSEFLKQCAICFYPVFWTANSSSQMNRLIAIIRNIEIVYSKSFNVLSEDYIVYSLFKKNGIDHIKQSDEDISINNDLKMKVYTVKQSLQNLVIHVKCIEDSIEKSLTHCIDDVNNTLNTLVLETKHFNELVSALQIYVLKTNRVENKKDKLTFCKDEENILDPEINEPINEVFKDQLFFGISEQPLEESDNIFGEEEIFDKSNNQSLILELKVALKDKQLEWKTREFKLFEKHPQLKNLSNPDVEYCDKSDFNKQEYENRIRKVAHYMSPDEIFSLQLPNKCVANEIAIVASKWNTVFQTYGDNTDSDSSITSNNNNF